MNDTIPALLQSFDLSDIPPQEQEAFTLELTDILMEKILKKAWMELDGTKRELLTNLLEESEMDPENTAKSEEIFTFLQENIVNLSEFITREIEAIQATYRQTRDQLLDAQS